MMDLTAIENRLTRLEKLLRNSFPALNVGPVTGAVPGQVRASTGFWAITDGVGALFAGVGADVVLYRGAADLWQTPDGIRVAGAINTEAASDPALGNGATLTLSTVLGAVGAIYHYTAAIAWSAANGYDVILSGYVARRGTSYLVQQTVGHASWAVAVNGSNQLTFTNNTGLAAAIYTSLLCLRAA